MSLTLVNRFSNNIGFLHTNTLHFKNVFLFLVALGLCCFRGFLPLVAGKGYSLRAVHGLLILMPSLVTVCGLYACAQ